MPRTIKSDVEVPSAMYGLALELERAFERADGSNTAPAEAPRRRWRKRPRRGKTLALAFAAILLLVVPVIVTLSGRSLDSPLSTEEALAEIAAAAKSNPLPFAAEDQFLYTHSRGMYMNIFVGGSKTTDGPALPSFTALVTRDRKVWVSVERFGLFAEKNEEVKWVTQRDRRNAEKHDRRSIFGRPENNVMGLAPNGKYFVGSEPLTRSQLLAYPTDPAVIYKRILEGLNGAGQGPADGVWQSLTESLYEQSFPADLRAGMVEALGLIPGVESLGVKRDPLGREGYAFAREHAGISQQVIFDVTTSSILYTHGELTKPSKEHPGWPVGTTTESYLQLEQKVVDEPPARLVKRLDR